MQENDFKWKIKKVNDIPSNPVHYLYCEVPFSTGTKRVYRIRQQQKASPGSYGGICVTKEVEYYILTEEIYRKNDDKKYEGLGESIVRVFTDLSEAKHRAYVQYEMIQNLITTYFNKGTKHQKK